MHPALQELIGRFEAAELHAARSGREVMAVLAQLICESNADSVAQLVAEVEKAIDCLLAVMPAYAPPLNVMHRIMAHLERGLAQRVTVAEIKAVIVREAERYQRWSEEARKRVAWHAAQVIPNDAVLFTFTLSETVMGALVQAYQEGRKFTVLVTESRPNRDGLTTAALLDKAGVPVRVSIDACIGQLVPQADMMLIGAEAVEADGSVVCKVGTYPAALVAKAHHVPVFVVADTMKLDVSSALGLPPRLTSIASRDVFPNLGGRAGVVGHLFDCTPATLIAGVVTERGILSTADCSAAIREMPRSETLMKKLARWAY